MIVVNSNKLLNPLDRKLLKPLDRKIYNVGIYNIP